jgi:putative heme-binding domain-containing protein
MRGFARFLSFAGSLWLSFSGIATFAIDPTTSLELRLASEPISSIVRDALREGDPARGAVLFHQGYLLCAKCHTPGPTGTTVGPDLARDRRGLSNVDLIRSVLDPSKEVRKGYETVTVATTDGKTITGLLAEDRFEGVVLRDPAKDGQTVTILKSSIEERRDGGPSLMPVGLLNTLGTRREALDLFRYLIEINQFGPSRAIELKPSRWEIAGPPLPSYESEIDHAGIIGALDAASYRRGEAVYNRVCVNCHGTKDQAGSLPTSLRFASGTFKNGSDSFAMYQTLTRGYGQMPAQSWMVPEQKYDVIHFIREAYLKPHNPSQYAAVTADSLGRLPKGSLRGPRPSAGEPWQLTDHGPSLTLTVQVGDSEANIAYKGIAIRLDPGPGGVAKGKRFVVYDHDTMQLVGAWSGEGFIDWNGINFNGRHEIHPKTVGTVHLANPVGPGWADPATGRFDDPRLRGRDGKPYGPLPRDWVRFVGLYRHQDQVVLSYTVGGAKVLEWPGAFDNPEHPGVDGMVFIRTIAVGRSSRDLAVRLAPAGVTVELLSTPGARVVEDGGAQVLRIPASATPLNATVFLSTGPNQVVETRPGFGMKAGMPEILTHGGPRKWGTTLSARAEVGPDEGPFAGDVLVAPENNPWACQFRFTGFDFFPDGRRAAACTWDGDVWMVSGVDDLSRPLSWQRIGSGLFQPLGLKVVDGEIFVACRDQIVILRDLNGDGETDFYETFNSDHQVTEHFHEFAMDLQTDSEGSFYYTKAARHAKTALVPQHGTLLKVSKDGASTEILARGFRAPNGVCLNSDGSFFLSDQEGHWTPKNRVNRVVKGGFYGNMWGYHDVTDASDKAMEQPLCWITNAFDRSPAELLWVNGASDPWGPLKGSLLSLSYGYGKVFVVPHETVDGQVQGGLAELPIRQFPTGLIRGRFHPGNGHLYLCGMFAWAGNQTQPGGFYRLRATGKPSHLPVGLHARKSRMQITFTEPLERKTAIDPTRWAVRTWSLKRSQNYGSKHYDEHPISVASVSLSDDGRTVLLTIPDLRPTMSMQIAYEIKGSNGDAVEGRIHNTIHHLGE